MNERQQYVLANPLARADEMMDSKFWRGIKHMGYDLSTIMTLNK